MSKKLTLGMSPLTRTIYTGSLLKCGKVWAANQTDVTQEFMGLIKEYVGVNNEMTVTSGGVPQFVVRVIEPGHTPSDIRELTQQRDELLAALKLMMNIERCTDLSSVNSIVTQAHAAITKAETTK